MKLPVIVYHKIILLYLLIIPLLCIPVSSSSILSDSYCEEIGTYNNNSTYQNNLNKVLSNLTNKSSVTGFGTYKAGVGSNTVYGLYNCRGDLDSPMCHECVQEASKLIITECPSKMEAIIWYHECTLRYANRSISSHFEDSPIATEYSEVYPDPNLAELLRDTMNGLIKKAAYDNSTKGYAEGKGILTKYVDTLHCLVQCTPDILGSQCEKCLRSAMTTMPKDLTFYMIFSPSCNVFYRIGYFAAGTTNNDSAVPPTPFIKGTNNAYLFFLLRQQIVLGVQQFKS